MRSLDEMISEARRLGYQQGYKVGFEAGYTAAQGANGINTNPDDIEIELGGRDHKLNIARRQRDQYKAERDQLLNTVASMLEVARDHADIKRDRFNRFIEHFKKAIEHRGNLLPLSTIILGTYNTNQAGLVSSNEERLTLIKVEVENARLGSITEQLANNLTQIMNLSEYAGGIGIGISVGLSALVVHGSAAMLADAILTEIVNGKPPNMQLIEFLCESWIELEHKPQTIYDALLETQKFKTQRLINVNLTQEAWEDQTGTPVRTLKKYLSIERQLEEIRQSPSALLTQVFGELPED